MPRKSSTFFGVEVAIGTHEAPGYLACFHDGKDGVVIDLFSRSLRLDVLRNRVGKFEGFFVLRRMQRSSTRRSIKQGLPTEATDPKKRWGAGGIGAPNVSQLGDLTANTVPQLCRTFKSANCASFSLSVPRNCSRHRKPGLWVSDERCCRHHFSGRSTGTHQRFPSSMRRR